MKNKPKLVLFILMNYICANAGAQSKGNQQVTARQLFYSNNATVITEEAKKSFGNAWIDFDNDGDEDLFVVNMGEHNSLYENLGNGKFKILNQDVAGSIVSDMGASFTTTWSDFNNDGLLDVFVGNFGEPSFLYIQDTNHMFTRVYQELLKKNKSNVQAASWIDFDSDGDLDLYLGTKEQPNQLFVNQGKHGFKLSSVSNIDKEITSTHGIAWSDINNDNFPDLFLAENYKTTRNLFYMSDNATLNKVLIDDKKLISIGASWVDFDNDLDMDLFITNAMDERNNLHLNNGSGQFKEIESNNLLKEKLNSMGACWGDYDNDGDQDVFIANSGNQHNSFYLNLGEGQFQKLNEKPFNIKANSSRGCTSGDYDGDGDLDLMVTNGFGEKDNNELYTNSGNNNNWLKLKLFGKTNRTPIGVKVIIKTTKNGIKQGQIREISSQSGAYGHNSYTVHFGIGNTTIIDEVKIKWMNGKIQIFKNIKPNKYYEILEGNALK